MVYKFVDEVLDLVDENDEVIAHEWRSIIREKKLRYIRGVAGFLKNSSGQLWIPIRSPEKTELPLAFDMSVAGHVGSGESYEQAFIRELEEELGLSVDTVTYRLLGKLTPREHGLSAFEIPYEQDPVYSRHDYCNAAWLYPHEILERIAAGQKTKSGLPVMMKTFYGAH